MDSKSKILGAVSVALESGEITQSDLRAILDNRSMKENPKENQTNRVSAVDVMFYIAGIVLFAAIAALIGQTWDSGAMVRILLSAGLGITSWTIALLYISRASQQDDLRRGLTNTLLLSGSMLLITGGFIIANEFFDYNDFNFYATSFTLTLLGALHISFGTQINRSLLTLLGVFLAVAAFPSLVFGLLNGSPTIPMFIYCLVLAISGGLLAYATRVVSWISSSSKGLGKSFDTLSAFTILMSLYAASYDENTGLLWLFVLIAGIVGLFYLSIVMQNKLMLGNGSFFLVLAVITVSFRYFSDYGIPISLLIAAFGLLGTAAVATSINRRYIASS